MDVRAPSPSPRRRPRFSLRARTALYVGTLVLLTAALSMGFFPWLYMRTVLRGQMGDRLRASAMGHAETVRTYVTGQHDRLALVASDDDIVELRRRHRDRELSDAAYRAATERILADVRATSGDIVSLSVVSPEGLVIASTSDALVGTDVSGSDSFERGRRGPFVELPTLAEYELEVAAPLHPGDGEHLGVVVADVDARQLARAMSAVSGPYETLRFRIGSDDGRAILFRDPVIRGGTVVQDESAFMRSALAGRRGVAETTNARGGDVFAAFLPVGVHGWGLVTEVDVAEAEAPLRELRGFVVVAIVFVLFAIGASYFGASRFVRPLVRLTQTSQAFAAGDLGARSGLRGGDELGILGQSFDEMATTLERQHRQLQAHLEARTEQLETAAEERDRARLDAELRERMFQALARSAPDAIVVANGDGAITDVNEATETLFGWTSDELRGLRLFELIAEPDRKRFEARAERVLAGAETDIRWSLSETRALREDGGTFPVDVSLAGWRDPVGRSWLTAMVRDVTPRKRAEEVLDRYRDELARSERFLNDIIENIPLMVFVKRADDLTYVLFNRAGEELTGLPRRTLIGHTDAQIFSEERARRSEQSDRETLATGQTVDIPEDSMERPGGDRRILHTIKHPVPDELGRLAYVLGISEDITEAKAKEEALRSARLDAEAASRAKSQFLANMSHEIRTPMNGILGMTQLLLGLDLDPKERDCAITIERSAHALLRLLNDMLDLSKIEAGQVQLDEVAFDLRDALGDTLQGLALQAAKSGLELIHEVAPDVPEHLIGDPNRLRQVLVNLVGNAIKFTDGGDIVVQVEQITRDQDRARLRFEVSDTGPGIPVEDQARIFEVFEQADETISRRYGGAGLGLAISQQLVRMMGGELQVESLPGQGSTFSFEIDLRLHKCWTELPEQVESLHQRRVLVAQSNATHRRVLTEMLLSWRMAPTSVATGAEALETLVRAADMGQPFELALVNGTLSDMDELEGIRRDARLRDLALVLIARPGEQDADRARRLRVGGWLSKPVRPSDLLRVIQSLLAPQVEVAARASGRRGDPLRILVADDDPVNQKVARVLLERSGHSVVVAGNGREAVDALARSHFDLVLMDVRMPVMDGFEATQEIREREEPLGVHTPIVALTAHAMRGDRERCLASGMDDYLSKPILADRLYAVVERARIVKRADEQGTRPAVGGPIGAGPIEVGPREPLEAPTPLAPRADERPSEEIAEEEPPEDDEARATQPPPDAESAAPGPERLVEWDAARERLGGSEETLEVVAQTLRERLPELRAMIRRGVSEGDSAALRDAAHGLKGSVGFLGAAPLVEAARTLEQRDEELTGEERDRLVDKVEALIDRVLEEIASRG